MRVLYYYVVTIIDQFNTKWLHGGTIDYPLPKTEDALRGLIFTILQRTKDSVREGDSLVVKDSIVTTLTEIERRFTQD